MAFHQRINKRPAIIKTSKRRKSQQHTSSVEFYKRKAKTENKKYNIKILTTFYWIHQSSNSKHQQQQQQEQLITGNQ